MNADSPSEDTSRIFPAQDYDPATEEPPQAMPEIGLSQEQVVDFRRWLAAGSPRYWKEQNMFPHLNDEQWLEYRKIVLLKAAVN